MDNPFNLKEFGAYLKSLRMLRKMSVREVAERTVSLFPHDKLCHISHMSLYQIEKGQIGPPPVHKLKALAQVYGENREFMLYKAGYLDRNPFKGPKEDPRSILNRYLDIVVHDKKRRPLTEEEKRSIGTVIENVVLTLTGGG